MEFDHNVIIEKLVQVSPCCRDYMDRKAYLEVLGPDLVSDEIIMNILLVISFDDLKSMHFIIVDDNADIVISDLYCAQIILYLFDHFSYMNMFNKIVGMEVNKREDFCTFLHEDITFSELLEYMVSSNILSSEDAQHIERYKTNFVEINSKFCERIQRIIRDVEFNDQILSMDVSDVSLIIEYSKYKKKHIEDVTKAIYTLNKELNLVSDIIIKKRISKHDRDLLQQDNVLKEAVRYKMKYKDKDPRYKQIANDQHLAHERSRRHHIDFFITNPNIHMEPIDVLELVADIYDRELEEKDLDIIYQNKLFSGIDRLINNETLSEKSIENIRANVAIMQNAVGIIKAKHLEMQISLKGS